MHPAVLEQDFRTRSGRLKAWGVGLLVVAGLLWVYAAWQLFVPYTSTYGKLDCKAVAFADREDLYLDTKDDWKEQAKNCALTRDWLQPVVALVLSVPLSTVGAVLLTTGSVSLRIREHDERRRLSAKS